MKGLGWAAFAAYVGCVLGANWAVQHFGIVPVGFGLRAPAGVWFVGLAFSLRDITQEKLGKNWTLLAIAAGCGLSAVVAGGALAFASASAFAVSELADFAVYTPLRRKGWLRAVALSNAVGLVVDSAVFLWLAFGSLRFIEGQVVGKAWMTAAAVVLMAGGRRALFPRDAPAELAR